VEQERENGLPRKKKKKIAANDAAEAPGAAAPEERLEAEEAAEAPDGEEGADAPEDGGEHEPADAPEETPEPTLEERLDAAEREAAEQAGKALRTLAEFDNYRRRMQRDLAQAGERGAVEVLRELLDVADNFDRALEHAGDDVPEAFLEGMRLVARGLHDLLDRRGVEKIEAVGTPFDPEFHEALTSLPSDEADPNTVLQEIQPGWRIGERVLRPAKVVVARAAEVEKDS